MVVSSFRNCGARVSHVREVFINKLLNSFHRLPEFTTPGNLSS